MPVQQILQARKTLTDAQIKAMPTAIVGLVPAPGANKVIVPVAAWGILNASAGAYATITDASLSLVCYGTPDIEEAVYASSPVLTEGLLGSINPALIAFQCAVNSVGVGSFAGFVVTGSPLDLSQISNVPLGICDKVSTSETDYTSGNAANTLLIVVDYMIIDV